MPSWDLCTPLPPTPAQAPARVLTLSPAWVLPGQGKAASGAVSTEGQVRTGEGSGA